MSGVRTRVIVGIAALALVAAACGSDSNQPAAGSDGTGGTAAGGGSGPGAGTRYGGGQDMTGSTGSTGTTGANADVSVSLNNYLFDPAVVKVTGGDVVAVRNGNARTPHTFTVVGENVDLELAPLTTQKVTIDLHPGTYQLICRFHEQLGMTATLKVS